MSEPLLPRRRLRASLLGRQLARTLGWLLATALLAAITIWAVSDAPQIRGDGSHYAGWPAASEVGVEGTRQSRGINWLMAFYELEVGYVADGHRYKGTTDFATALGGVDTDSAPDVHYDPRDPTRFILSWAADATGARYRFVVLAGLLFGFLTLVFLAISFSPLSEYRSMRRCVLHGQEVIATLVEYRHAGGKSTETIYRYRIGDGQEKTTSFRTPHRPLFLDADDSKMLAIAGGDDVVVLRGDFYPVSLSARQQTEVRTTIASDRDR